MPLKSKRLISMLLICLLIVSSVPVFARTEVAGITDHTLLSIDSVLESNTEAVIPEDARYTPRRVLAVVNSKFKIESLEKLSALTNQSEHFSVKTLMDLAPEDTKIVSIDSSGLDTPDLLKLVSAVPGTESAQPDYIQTHQTKTASAASSKAVGTSAPPGTPLYFDQQYFLRDRSEEYPTGTNVSYLWDGKWSSVSAEKLKATKGDSQVVIAVLDSGVDYTNPDLTPVMWDGNSYGTTHHGWAFGMTSVDSISDDPMDIDIHGTHVAGIIAAAGKYNVSGMAPNVRILPLAFPGVDNNSTYQAIRAYDRMIRLKQQGVNIVAVNNSWGGGPVTFPAAAAAIKKAGENGIISVFAAGNSSLDLDKSPQSPNSSDPRYDLHIGSVNRQGMPSSFSNYGEETVDLFAPGEDIWSTVPESSGTINSAHSLTRLSGQNDSWSVKSFLLEKDGTETEHPLSRAELDTSAPDHPVLTWHLPKLDKEIIEQKKSFALEISFGDQSGIKDRVSSGNVFFHQSGTVKMTPEDPYARLLYILVQTVNDAGQKEWTSITPYVDNRSNFIVPQNESYPFSTDLFPDELKQKITWDDFKIRFIRIPVEAEIGQTATFSFQETGLYSSYIPANMSSGTSMAAPVVTGGIALLASAYGYTNPELSTARNMSELRARIKGGVARLDSLNGKALSEGTLDLKKAVESPYPVIDSFTQDENRLNLEGYFFGNNGSVEMDGTKLTIESWNDHQITAILPDGTSYSRHQFKVIANHDPAQWGREFYTVSPFSQASEDQAAKDYFEKIPVSWKLNNTKLALDTGSQYMQGTYSMAALDHKIYINWTDQSLPSGESENRNHDGAVVYAWDTRTQQTKILFPNGMQKHDVWFGATDDKLLFARYTAYHGENSVYEFQHVDHYSIGAYDPKTDRTEILGDFSFKGSVLPAQLVYHNGYVWSFGGSEEYNYFGSAQNHIPIQNVYRMNLQTGQTEEMPPLQVARTAPCVIFRGDMPIVAGGIGEHHSWINSSETLDLSAMKWKKTEDAVSLKLAPDQYLLGDYSYAPFDGTKIILNGPVSENEKNDVWIYDTDLHTWAPYEKSVDPYNVNIPYGMMIGNDYYVFGFTLPNNNVRGILYRDNDKVGLASFEPEKGISPTDHLYDINEVSVSFYRTRLTGYEETAIDNPPAPEDTDAQTEKKPEEKPVSQNGSTTKTTGSLQASTVKKDPAVSKQLHAVSTGDTTFVLPYVTFFILSGLGILSAAAFKRRRRQ